MNDTLCPYMFIKWSQNGYEIIVVHINDLNIITTPNELIWEDKVMYQPIDQPFV